MNRRIAVLQTAPLDHLGMPPHGTKQLILTGSGIRTFSLPCRFKPLGGGKKMERETGIEPATSTLARLHSTAELLPQLNFGIDAS